MECRQWASGCIQQGIERDIERGIEQGIDAKAGRTLQLGSTEGLALATTEEGTDGINAAPPDIVTPWDAMSSSYPKKPNPNPNPNLTPSALSGTVASSHLRGRRACSQGRANEVHHLLPCHNLERVGVKQMLVGLRLRVQHLSAALASPGRWHSSL